MDFIKGKTLCRDILIFFAILSVLAILGNPPWIKIRILRMKIKILGILDDLLCSFRKINFIRNLRSSVQTLIVINEGNYERIRGFLSFLKSKEEMEKIEIIDYKEIKFKEMKALKNCTLDIYLSSIVNGKDFFICKNKIENFSKTQCIEIKTEGHYIPVYYCIYYILVHGNNTKTIGDLKDLLEELDRIDNEKEAIAYAFWEFKRRYPGNWRLVFQPSKAIGVRYLKENSPNILDYLFPERKSWNIWDVGGNVKIWEGTYARKEEDGYFVHLFLEIESGGICFPHSYRLVSVDMKIYDISNVEIMSFETLLSSKEPGVPTIICD